MRREAWTSLRISALVGACLLFAVAVWQSPHIVHHLFDPDEDQQHECAFSTAAERAQATGALVFTLAPIFILALGAVASAHVALRSRAHAPISARAPPALSS
jgi:Na+-driven multidrug efflux pump